jgi:hypothetical protein
VIIRVYCGNYHRLPREWMGVDKFDIGGAAAADVWVL